MFMRKILTLFTLLLNSLLGIAQENATIRILIADGRTNEVLPYANILFVNQGNGTISNEAGYFSINTSEFKETDSIRIQYIGYKNKLFEIGDILKINTILLEEELINLSEAWVYGNPPKAKDIIRKVIENKNQNYQPFTAKSLVFVRNKVNTRFKELDTYIKKNSINEIEEGMIERIVSRIPRDLTSFKDYLTYSYTYKNSFDSVKLAPQKVVSLEEIEIAEMDQFGKIFENLFKDTEEGEYWKVKSGIFSEKLDMEEEENDTINKEQEKHENQIPVWTLKYDITSSNKYASLNDEKLWEFLYKPGKYKYELIGGSKVNGEDVFIIDFKPKGGKFVGRVYVSTSTYALLKADFRYGEGKDGRDIQLLGVGYHEDKYQASISYENIDGNYQLKYLSKSQSISFSFERPVSLLKKKKRFLWDKKEKEIKIKLNIAAQTEEMTEILVLNSQSIPESDFLEFIKTDWTDVIYVDHYSDEHWKGYPVIEPTKNMREYQKQEIDWEELGKK